MVGVYGTDVVIGAGAFVYCRVVSGDDCDRLSIGVRPLLLPLLHPVPAYRYLSVRRKAKKIPRPDVANDYLLCLH